MTISPLIKLMSWTKSFYLSLSLLFDYLNHHVNASIFFDGSRSFQSCGQLVLPIQVAYISFHDGSVTLSVLKYLINIFAHKLLHENEFLNVMMSLTSLPCCNLIPSWINACLISSIGVCIVYLAPGARGLWISFGRGSGVGGASSFSGVGCYRGIGSGSSASGK